MARAHAAKTLVLFPLVFAAVAHGVVKIIKVEDLTEVVLDIAAVVDTSKFEESIQQFNDFTVLAITPKESHVLVAVKDEETDIYVCQEDSNDSIHEVMLYRDGDVGYVIVFADKGTSIFCRNEDVYTEIKDHKDMPQKLMALFPVQSVGDEYYPLCSSESTTDEEEGSTSVVQQGGNLEGSGACVVI